MIPGCIKLTMKAKNHTTRMAGIQNPEHKHCWVMEELILLLNAVGNAKVVHLLAIAYKTKYTLTVQASCPVPPMLPKGLGISCVYKSLHIDVDSDFI